MSAYEFFDRVYVVHLPDKKRREHIEAQLEKIGKVAEFVHAAKPKFGPPNTRRNHAGEFGASLSHVKAIVKAISDGAERPLFLEDDVVFDGEPAVSELPDYWSILYLGGHPREKVARYSDHLVRVGRFSFAEAYAISRPCLLNVFAHWCDRVGQRDAAYDLILGEYAHASHGFACYPIVTRQVVGYSHISGEQDEKRHLLVKGWASNLDA